MDGATEESVATRQAMRMALLASARRYIEQHLASPQLCADVIARRFGRSRATLYRLFEAEGGLTRYIQGRRLQRAYSELASPANSYRRILDIALDSHFASDATFNRAFRRAYGVPPGEFRDNLRALRGREREGQMQGDGASPAVKWI